jgi:ATP/maltotriose-dependent transcriptional regulator MalT
MSLGAEDDDLVLFLSHLLAAIEDIDPDGVAETLSLLRTASLPPHPVLTRSLVNERDQVECSFVLVLRRG